MFTNTTFEKQKKTKKMLSYKENERHIDGKNKSHNTRERQKARKQKDLLWELVLGE